jgi:hypothetical protein
MFIFFRAEENEPKEGALCHEPEGLVTKGNDINLHIIKCIFKAIF